MTTNTGLVRCALLVGAVLSGGCATAIAGHGDSIARLERARATDPGSEAVQRSLGIAYFKANRFAEARMALQQAATADPRDGVAALYLGLTAEAQEDLSAARAAYESYLRFGKTRRVKNQISARLAIVAREENALAVKRALALEQQLASQPGSPLTIAVLPFTFTGSDTSLKPLERGFAELVATDLTRSARLTVVDRARLQALLDEIELQQTAGIENATGIRAGRILQAGRIVGGSISQLTGSQLRADAFITNVQTAAHEGTGANDQRALDELFTLEKNIVLRLFDDMGVTLTTAERNAIEQRPTRSLAAFLAYSRGLDLEDRGRFEEAARLFDNALRLDPGFGSARQRSQGVKSAAMGGQVSARTVEAGLRATSEGAAVAAAERGSTSGNTGGQALATAEDLNPSVAAAASAGGGGASTQPQKDPSSGTGTDNVSTKTGRITIVIRHP
jgi:tetratricopeptide (TPR) repeat protein